MHTVQYELVNIPANDLTRIKLPRFQRKLVWPKSKKERFINTLHEGLPFGSVLVYPESQEPDADLLIIDGQQRLSTIIEFNRDRLKFWKPLNPETYNSALLSINSALPNDVQLSESEFDILLHQDKQSLDDWLDDIDDKTSRKAVRGEFSKIKQELSDYVDLSSQEPYRRGFLSTKPRRRQAFEISGI